jgi:hypothetical protein
LEETLLSTHDHVDTWSILAGGRNCNDEVSAYIRLETMSHSIRSRPAAHAGNLGASRKSSTLLQGALHVAHLRYLVPHAMYYEKRVPASYRSVRNCHDLAGISSNSKLSALDLVQFAGHHAKKLASSARGAADQNWQYFEISYHGHAQIQLTCTTIEFQHRDMTIRRPRFCHTRMYLK